MMVVKNLTQHHLGLWTLGIRIRWSCLVWIYSVYLLAGSGLHLINQPYGLVRGGPFYISKHILNTDFNGLRSMNPPEWIRTRQLILHKWFCVGRPAKCVPMWICTRQPCLYNKGLIAEKCTSIMVEHSIG